MLEQLREAYSNQKRVRYSLCGGTLVFGLFLVWISGGFPPSAWHFLFQTLPQVPRLWTLKGPAMLFPLLALLLLSLALLCCWVLLVATILWLARQQWLYYREQKDFDASLEVVEDASIQDLDIRSLNTFGNGSQPQSQHWWEVDTAGLPKQGIKVARASRTSNSLPSTPVPSVNTMPPMPPISPVSPSPQWSPVPPVTPAVEPQAAISRGPLQPVKQRRHPKSHPVLVGIEKEQEECEEWGEQGVRLAIGTGLDTGITRKNKPNEDNLLAIQGMHTYNQASHPFGLFIVADGMGGHSKGQEASRMAIRHIRDVVMPTLLSNAEIDGGHARELLLDGVQHANLAIYQHNRQHQIDMGTTLTAAMLVDTTIVVTNVGDSRTYRYTEQDGLRQVTKDHSLVAQLFERGEITEDDIYVHPQRNEIFRCLGEKASVLADTFTLPLEVGSTFLLCSDGLWEMVKNARIEEILRDTLPNAVKTSEALIQAALDGGGKDNISAIVVHVLSTPPPPHSKMQANEGLVESGGRRSASFLL